MEYIYNASFNVFVLLILASVSIVSVGIYWLFFSLLWLISLFLCMPCNVFFFSFFFCFVISDWKLYIMHFTFLDAGYFCIPINILEFCSGIQLNYLASCFEGFLDRIRAVLSLGMIILYYWGEAPLSTLPKALRFIQFSVYWWEWVIFLGSWEHLGPFLVVLSLTLVTFLTCMCWSVLFWTLKRHLL